MDNPEQHHDRESIEVQVIGPKSSLVALSKSLGEIKNELKVVQPDERAYGEPGTVFLVIFAASVAMPAILAWIYRNKEGIEYERVDEFVSPEGTTRKCRIIFRLDKSSPPSPEQIEEIAKMTHSDIAKINEAIKD
jgi:hypothetical protein